MLIWFLFTGKRKRHNKKYYSASWASAHRHQKNYLSFTSSTFCLPNLCTMGYR